MVRQTREEAAATREALLDAAERVFRDTGVAHATLADVAKAAGMSRGAVYWHFRDKTDLFNAMCERAVLPLERMLEQAGLVRLEDPLATLRALCLRGLGQLAADRRTQAVFEVMFHKCEISSEPGAAQRRNEATDRDCRRHLERVIRQAAATGQLPPDTDTALATEGMHAYMVGLMHQWVLDPGAYDLAHAAPALIDMWLAGLKAHPPRRATTQRKTNGAKAAPKPRVAAMQ